MKNISKVIDDISVSINFTNHSFVRFNRTGMEQCKLETNDIIEVFYDKIEGESMVWAIQDYLKVNEPTEIILIDKDRRLSLVVNAIFSTYSDELIFDVITVWDGLDIRYGINQLVLKLAM